MDTERITTLLLKEPTLETIAQTLDVEEECLVRFLHDTMPRAAKRHLRQRFLSLLDARFQHKIAHGHPAYRRALYYAAEKNNENYPLEMLFAVIEETERIVKWGFGTYKHIAKEKNIHPDAVSGILKHLDLEEFRAYRQELPAWKKTAARRAFHTSHYSVDDTVDLLDIGCGRLIELWKREKRREAKKRGKKLKAVRPITRSCPISVKILSMIYRLDDAGMANAVIGAAVGREVYVVQDILASDLYRDRIIENLQRITGNSHYGLPFAPELRGMRRPAYFMT